MNEIKAIGILTLIVSVILCLLFREVIWYPNDFLFSPVFDGIKNYFTFVFYILYDNGVHFSGMNYPFGENIIYTDNQPFYAVLLRFINKNIWGISGYLIGIFNYIIILSLLLGTIVMYKLLRKCLLPHWYSIFTAIIIIFLAQQNNMMAVYAGAYALSYTWVLPLQWYLIIKVFEREKVYKWLIIYVVSNLIIGFIHPYYFLFNFLFILFTIVFDFILRTNYKNVNFKFLLIATVSSILPLVGVKLYLYLTDPITDRPLTPLGLTQFRGNVAEIFYPAETVLGKYWQVLFNLNISKYEGYGYIGVPAIIIIILTNIKLINYLAKRNFRFIFKPVLPVPLRLAVWPAIAILLFAFGFPFRLRLEKLYDYVPFVKQFRFLVRFLWIFYYVISVYTAFYIYQLYRYLQIRISPHFAVSFIFFFLISWALDASINVSSMIQEIRQNRVAKDFRGETFNYKNFLAKHGYKAKDFQAIMPVPYFTAGSEKLFFQPVIAIPYAMAASVQTGLPLINVMMSRTSLHQSLQGIQLLSNNFIEKDILKALPSAKPLLLLVVEDSLQLYEKSLINKSKLISQHNNVKFYILPLSAFTATAKDSAVQAFINGKFNLIQEGNIYKTQAAANTVVNTFTNNIAQKWLFDKGALTAAKGPLTVYHDKIPQATKSKEQYDVSLWFNMESKFPPETMEYFQFDQDQNLVDRKTLNISESVEIYKKWVNLNFKFNLMHPQNTIKVVINGADLLVDELLIKPSDLNIYKVTPENVLIYNNFLIGRIPVKD